MNPLNQSPPNRPLPDPNKRPSIRESLRVLQTPLRFLKGVGPKRAEELEKFGLKSVEDLLYHLPFRYEDRRQIKKISDATIGGDETFVGEIRGLQKKYNPRRRAQLLVGSLIDDSGSLGLLWYRAPAYLSNSLAQGQRLLVHGKVEPGLNGQKRIVHPEFEVLEADGEESLQKILPVYVHPAAVSLSLLRNWVNQALSHYARFLPSYLPVRTKQRQGLMALAEALAQLHEPGTTADLAALNSFSSRGHRSVVFDELFYLQLGLGLRKQGRRREEGVPFRPARQRLAARMRELLPFKLTGAQERVLREIDQNMSSAQAMQRLVQGDVGSGKTMVAWLASLRVIENGYQAVWMAPTELLAEQHFRNISHYADALGIKAALLTGSQAAKDRSAALERIAGGQIQFVVGTHALIQEGVSVPKLGLGVIDEQHRFGVVQRLSLQRLLSAESGTAPIGKQPHMLLMSATPIPRSLAMVLYGDMEVSFLDEMPPGRLPIQTKVYYEQGRRSVYQLVIKELRAGRQAFIVYPLVEASEELAQVRDATQMAEKMRQGVFKDFGVGLVHGKMSTAERDEVMRSFRDGGIGVLVATTVIEVGIDIPNATVMVIEHAERFGLSQLHQLRGRVGRGRAGGYCLLINRAPRNPLAEQRLRVMERQHDGFKIAEADLAMRGPGEFLGTRQSGLGDFRLANLVRDAKILMEARKEAQAWLEKDPELSTSESSELREVLLHRWGQRLQLGAVG
ncbi:MAG TPA: ATP-dependent DNA helicase RecG [Candidatus Binatia bacterium]